MRDYCEELFLTFLYCFKSMSSKDSTSNQGGEESSFMLHAIQQQFERMNVVFNEIRDQMDKHPQRIPNARRQERHKHMDDFDDDHEDKFEDEDDQASLNGESRFVPRGERHGRGF
jgi:hypothetical protein